MMDRLVREFQNENLVPMKQGGHAAARGIFRGTKALSGLITDEDFSMLLGEDYFPPMWVANPPQRNQREDNFLSMLEIEQWTIDNFVSSLSELDPNTRQAWMSGKSDEWHQDLYEQMYDHINIGSRKSTESIRIQSILNQIEIVKCSDGIYRSGKKCYFPVKDVYYDEILPRVSSGVYQYGGDDGTKSYEFLKFIGVQHVDRIIEIKGILQYRYSKESIDLYAKNIELAEIKIFIEFVNENPQYSDIFENYYIFKLKNDHWGTPNHLYLDAPYMDTELSAWYALQDVVDDKQPLSDQYKSLDLSPKIIGDFAQSVGAQSKLIISEQRAHQNPNWEYLSRNGGSQFTGTGVDVDYHIPNLLEFLENPSITKAALIWKTMNEMCEKHYSCKYLNARFLAVSSG